MSDTEVADPAPVTGQSVTEPAPVEGAVPSLTDQNTVAADPAAQPAGWRDKFPEDMRNSPQLTKFKSEEDMARGYMNLEKMVGTDKIARPKNDASFDEKQQFLRDAGFDAVPLADEKYEYNLDEIHEDFKGDIDNLTSFVSQKGRELGIGKNQLQTLMNDYLVHQTDQYKEAEKLLVESRSTQMGDLRREMGSAFDYKFNLAKHAVQKADEVTGGEISKILDDKNLGYLKHDPNVVKMLMHFGEIIAPDKVDLGDGPSEFSMTPQQATDEMNKLKADKEWTAKFMAGDEICKNKWQKLIEIQSQG